MHDELLDGFESGFNISGHMVINLLHVDKIVLSASTIRELQKLVERIHTHGRSEHFKNEEAGSTS